MVDTPRMSLEIVCHCWNYSRLLTYQLSSLVLFPPKDVGVTMTVFHNEEDERTVQVLDYFRAISADNVSWNWRQLEKPLLFRRAIGRNMAALETKADWIFFTDCDQVFREGCIDSFTQLMSIEAPLVYPRYVNCTTHIGADNPILEKADEGPAILDIDPADFQPVLHTRAIGGVQVARGDVVRQTGYCKDIPRFMKPARKFHRTREDVVFRRLLGTPGEPVDMPNIFRIEHKQKGRFFFSWKNRL